MRRFIGNRRNNEMEDRIIYDHVFCDYVPRPEPVTVDRIVAAHYYPSWKKGAAGLHNGFDDLHSFPERTPLIGYYDGDNPELCDWEIKWALEHGINCFVYCWYRKKENSGKPVTVSDLRLGETLHNGFLKARYSSMMQFAIMLEASPKWAAAEDERDLLEHLMPFWLEEYFSRENYLKIDNQPVLFVYDFYGKQLQNNLGSPEAQRAAFDRCREMARKHGFDGMIFAAEYRRPDFSVTEEMRARGYDFCFPYCQSFKVPDPTVEQVVEHQLSMTELRCRYDPNYCATVASCMWDPTPRFTTMPQTYTRENNPSLWTVPPKAFRTMLEKTKKILDAQPADAICRKLLFLDNWNEWDEGHYLFPSLGFGFQYLQAVREVFSKRDNLPDYRLPAPLGIDRLNTQWDIPDFGKKH